VIYFQYITPTPLSSVDHYFASMKKQLFAIFAFLLLQMPLAGHV